jgi:hypothetical protein
VNFQISKTSGADFASSLTFSPTNGTLAATTVYVRMNRSTAGSSSGNITHTSLDTDDVNWRSTARQQYNPVLPLI